MSAEVFRAAIPAALSVAAGARRLEPSKNVTVPTGVAGWPVTVAVRMIVVPAVAGFIDELTTVVVGSCTTGKLKGVDIGLVPL